MSIKKFNKMQIKLFIFICFLIISAICVLIYFKHTYKTINLNKISPNQKANEIMFNFILQENEKLLEIYKKIEEMGNKSVIAEEVDLNSDNVNEIVGFCSLPK